MRGSEWGCCRKAACSVVRTARNEGPIARSRTLCAALSVAQCDAMLCPRLSHPVRSLQRRGALVRRVQSHATARVQLQCGVDASEKTALVFVLVACSCSLFRRSGAMRTRVVRGSFVAVCGFDVFAAFLLSESACGVAGLVKPTEAELAATGRANIRWLLSTVSLLPAETARPLRREVASAACIASATRSKRRLSGATAKQDEEGRAGERHTHTRRLSLEDWAS